MVVDTWLDKMFGNQQPELIAFIRVLRPQQWTKNVLLFVPVILARQVDNVNKMKATILGFVAFSACASAVYVLNDVLDIVADRQHPFKRDRPFASGTLPLRWSPVIFLVPLMLGFTVSAAFLNAAFTAVLALYMLVAIAYAYWLKRQVLLDVYTLAGLYTLRIVGGGLVSDVIISDWLLVFSLFMFTSLAFAKRFAELARLSAEGRSSCMGRGYLTTDIGVIQTSGQASGCVAVLVLALYIHSPEVNQVYGHRWPLWAICPIILYWITRLWLQAMRHTLSEDPVVFAVKDRVSVVCGGAVAMLLWFA